MDIFLDFLKNIWYFLNAISFYILLGLVFAGVIKQLIPDTFIKKHIGSNSFSSILKAAVLGIPLPLCSCSVIPFASSLKKSGASKSALQTFLIATPITGVDSILATYGIFGWFFTLYRVISSVCISLLAGVLSMLFVKEEPKKVVNSLWSTKASVKLTPLIEPKKNITYRAFLRNTINYAFDTLLKDITKPLFIGIILGAFFATIIPENFTQFFSENLLLSYLLLIVIGAPMYVCALSSLPIGLTLLLTGFSPGSVFVFLSAGPATNLVTISVVKNMLGAKSTGVYLFSVIMGSIFFAYLLDTLFLEYFQTLQTQMIRHEEASLLDAISSIILALLFSKYLAKKRTL